ncbi:hypothetical protein EYF80_030593 [Liparis tanakae]|uniref:Uncharacterized protein n=1 Tax=Liparis tanakae TaxID=230148 RepID=A0A4Z2H194_9TELE|nr:hypothetical protein EYF80_030593 [Liparis tanakae]
MLPAGPLDSSFRFKGRHRTTTFTDSLLLFFDMIGFCFSSAVPHPPVRRSLMLRGQHLSDYQLPCHKEAGEGPLHGQQVFHLCHGTERKTSTPEAGANLERTWSYWVSERKTNGDFVGCPDILAAQKNMAAECSQPYQRVCFTAETWSTRGVTKRGDFNRSA